ncbi:MAG: SpoIIE family protein phosphatase [Ignavibacteria bacterium]|nr:SpoIIE family protein phosphatase [Ignavibacteria bacterium]
MQIQRLSVFFSTQRIFFFYLCIPLLLFSGCRSDASLTHSVTFQITTTPGFFTQQLYLTGNHKLLGKWKPAGLPLVKINDSTWQARIIVQPNTSLIWAVTGGDWWKDACSQENPLSKFRDTLEITHDTTLNIRISRWAFAANDGQPLLTSTIMPRNNEVFYLDWEWKYFPGDTAQAAARLFDDRNWRSTISSINGDEFAAKPATGWFRFHFHIDSSLWNKPLGFKLHQFGAAEFYYNGRLLVKSGRMPGDSGGFSAYNDNYWKIFITDKTYDNVFAIKYSAPNWKKFANLGFDPGFTLLLGNALARPEYIEKDTINFTKYQFVFIAIPLTLSFVHLFLFVFYPQQRQNLFYCLCLMGFAGISYAIFQRNFTKIPDDIIFYTAMLMISMTAGVFFGVLSSYAISSTKLPRTWILHAVIAITLTILSMYLPGSYLSKAIYAYFGISIIDMLRPKPQNANIQFKGRWIMLTGFIILVIFIGLQFIIDYNIIKWPFSFTLMYVIGMLGLAVSISLFLSYNFAATAKNLEVQLETVKELSAEALEKERVAHELMLERKIIELENERKSRELESARRLQLSLLPKEIPVTGTIQIACYMNTASEVGGDYYDFFMNSSGVLHAVIGDATGHGLAAGNMVCITKGLLNSFTWSEPLPEILSKTNNALKRMHINMLYMGLSVVRYENYQLSFAAAGMPPVLHFHSAGATVHTLEQKSMPLGAFKNFPYTELTVPVLPGDILLLFSDGIIELFNKDREMFSLQRLQALLPELVNLPMEQLIARVIEETNIWTADKPIDDDITILAMKIV